MKTKMKLVPFVLLMIFASCSDDGKPNDLETVSKQYFINDLGKSATSGIPITITATFNKDTEEILSTQLNPEGYEALGITREQFQNALDQQDFNFAKSGDDPNEGLSPHAMCIETCIDKYTDSEGNKKRGRGACKANCWVDTGIRIIEALVPAL
jgi:hypothetical protein